VRGGGGDAPIDIPTHTRKPLVLWVWLCDGYAHSGHNIQTCIQKMTAALNNLYVHVVNVKVQEVYNHKS